VLKAVLADVLRAASDAQPYLRYLVVPEWLSDKERDDLLTDVRIKVNQISTYPEIQLPQELIEGTLLRIDLRDYQLSPTTWDKFAKINVYYLDSVKEEDYIIEHVRFEVDHPGGPYTWPDGTYVPYVKPGHYLVECDVKKPKPGGKVTNRFQGGHEFDPKVMGPILALTESPTPVVRADQFARSVSRQLSIRNKEEGVGYYDWFAVDYKKGKFGIKNRDDVFKLARLSQQDNREVGKDIRAALDKSGVSEQGRQIVGLRAVTGDVWITLDTDDDTGSGNPVANLDEGDYKHKAEELYWTLPNELPGYYLSDVNGVTQNSAPDFIGGNKSTLNPRNDMRIHVGDACWDCHAGSVLKPVDDWARRTYTAGKLQLTDFKYQRFLRLRRQYLSDLDERLARARDVYTKAIWKATGKMPQAVAESLSRERERFLKPLDLAHAAAESYTTPEVMKAKLELYAAGQLAQKKVADPELAVLARGGTIIRTHWEERYRLNQLILKGVVPVDPKGKP
jgi:hypothetical protein